MRVRSTCLLLFTTLVLFVSAKESVCSADGNCDDVPAMPYRFLGRTGLKVSALSFGAWVTFGNQIGDDRAYELLALAYERGLQTWDNAEAYAAGAAEETMGRVYHRGLNGDGPWKKRSDLVITTKIFWGGKGPNDRGLSRKHILEGLTASLERLQLSYVDVVFAHRPDPATPMEETVRAFTHVINQGQAMYWGTSEWSAAEIRDAVGVANRLGLIAPVVEQPEYNLLHRQRFEVEYGPLYRDLGYGTTIWSPLASGILTNKYVEGIPAGSRLATEPRLAKRYIEGKKHGDWDVVIKRVADMATLAEEIGCSPAQVAIAWTLKNDNVSTCILGATKISQLEDNLDSLRCLPKLTDAVMERLSDIMQSQPEHEIDFRNW